MCRKQDLDIGIATVSLREPRGALQRAALAFVKARGEALDRIGEAGACIGLEDLAFGVAMQNALADRCRSVATTGRPAATDSV